jgi:hypothetical protein
MGFPRHGAFAVLHLFDSVGTSQDGDHPPCGGARWRKAGHGGLRPDGHGAKVAVVLEETSCMYLYFVHTWCSDDVNVVRVAKMLVGWNRCVSR